MLYNLHMNLGNTQTNFRTILLNMELKCSEELFQFIETFNKSDNSLEELDDLMKDCVETEVKFFR